MNMILITLSMFLAVVIIQTHIRGDRKNKVPIWLKRVSNGYIYFAYLFSWADPGIKLLRGLGTSLISA